MWPADAETAHRADTIEFTQGDAIFIPAVPLTCQHRFRRARVRVFLPRTGSPTHREAAQANY